MSVKASGLKDVDQELPALSVSSVSVCRNQRQSWTTSADGLHQERRVVKPRLRQCRAAPPAALLHLHPQV